MNVIRQLILLGTIALLTAAMDSCSRQQTGTGPTTAKDSVAAVDSTAAAVSPVAPVVSLTYEERQGRDVYLQYCAVCHGDEGKGDGFNSYNLDPKPRDFSDKKYMEAFSDARLYETIDQGGRGVNKSVLMPSWGGRLNSREIRFVIAYVRSFSTPPDTSLQ